MNSFKDKIKPLLSGMVFDKEILRRATICDPIPIYTENKIIDKYFIGIAVEDKLIGFCNLDEENNFTSYSSFQRDQSTLLGCPLSKSWLDIDYIKNTARKLASPEDNLETPYLSFDNNISRIAWIVIAINKTSGKKRKIFVAGDYVYFG